jgi:hypothetical protein
MQQEECFISALMFDFLQNIRRDNLAGYRAAPGLITCIRKMLSVIGQRAPFARFGHFERIYIAARRNVVSEKIGHFFYSGKVFTVLAAFVPPGRPHPHTGGTAGLDAIGQCFNRSRIQGLGSAALL